MDIKNNFKGLSSVDPFTEGGNTAQVGNIIDLKGSMGCVFFTNLNIADGDATVAVTFEHGDNAALSDTAAVTDADLIGTLASTAYIHSEDNVVKSVGYKGNKRYIRQTLTPSANSGTILGNAIVVLAKDSLPVT